MVESEADAGVECEENVSKADNAWREYTKNNQSVIIDSFQGQFQSVMTCEKCCFVSTTYEPFMVLSLSIPHAMETQFVITWLPSLKFSSLPGMNTPKKYVVTVNKNSCLGDVRTALMLLLKKEDAHVNSNDVILAEVKSSSQVKILDDRTLVAYIKDSLYAIEIIQSIPKITLNGSKDVLLLPDKKMNENVDEQALESDETMPCDVTQPTLDSAPSEPTIPEPPNTNLSAWHSCSICLEETFDEELNVHEICGGLLCKECLKNTIEYNKQSKFNCPICNGYISSEEYVSYVQPSNGNNKKKQIRQVLVPVLFRKPLTNSETKKFDMFGHPRICSIPSEISCTEVTDIMHGVLNQWSNIPTTYKLVITDGSGLSCGLCDLFSTCNGCCVADHEMIRIKPGCCLTIDFYEITIFLIDMMSHSSDDSTMSSLRSSDNVTLNECLQSFAEVEYLSETNPWYCPQCKRNQSSAKSMTVTKWPDVLIIHLKRFYFEGSQGCKINCPVEFPLQNLNIDILASADNNTMNESSKLSPLYDLYGCICHVGTLYGGHYTAFTKSNEDWYLFNDETYEKACILEEDYKKGYVLFYQKKMCLLHSVRGNILLHLIKVLLSRNLTIPCHQNAAEDIVGYTHHLIVNY